MTTTQYDVINDLEGSVEAMVDKHGVNGVLYALANVCGLKASHIEENWQDRILARGWEQMAKRVNKAADDNTKNLPGSVTGPF